METTNKMNEKTDIEKSDNYILLTETHRNIGVYSTIKQYEEIIFEHILFCKPNVDNRKVVDNLRNTVKSVACKKCIRKNRFDPIFTISKVFKKSDVLSTSLGKIVLVENKTSSTKMTSACTGCRVLAVKQVATGFIKGRTFKQV